VSPPRRSRPPGNLVVGDTASLDRNGIPLPGVAQVALHRADTRAIDSQTHRGRTRAETIQYFDKGNMAVVGKGSPFCKPERSI